MDRPLTALHDHCPWVEYVHDLGHDGLKQRVEGLVVSAILQGAGVTCDKEAKWCGGVYPSSAVLL